MTSNSLPFEEIFNLAWETIVNNEIIIPWKADNNDEITMVQEFYKFSPQKAKAALKVLTPAQKDIIKHNDLLFVSCGDHSIKRISSDGTFTTVSGLENNSGLINGLDAILEFDDFKQKNRPSRYNNPNQMQLDNSNNLWIYC